MVDYVKKKIVEKLAKFTKNLKPSDISVSFLSGKGHLSNLELNAEFISGVLQLPSWISVSRVVCDTIKARVPFTSLKTDPVNFYIGQVLVDITTATQATNTTSSTSNSSSSKLLNKLGNPSKYGMIEKVIDGMKVEIRSVLIFLKDPTFHAQLEMNEILLQSTSPAWQQVPLSKSRLYLDDEDSVINYKLLTWSSLKIEGWSTAGESPNSQNQLRLIVGATSVRISFKRRVSDSSLMAFRISMHLGDLIWILTQTQLRAVSRLVQSLMDAAVRTQQQKRGADRDSDAESVDSLESVTTSNDRGKPNTKTAGGEKGKGKKQSRSSQRYERVFEERMKEYMEGRRNLPSHEVIQNSFHMKTGKVDLQLCDDTTGSGAEGSLLIQIFQLGVDLYLDQPACSGRAHWNKANDVVSLNTTWSRDLVSKASKTQYVDLPSIHLGYLRERGVVIRCADFSVGTFKSGMPKSPAHQQHAHASLPIVASDKKTFNIPDDVHNPAFQVGLTMYFYADKYGNKFLVPRPNVSVYVSPIHVNVHQETCLWLVEFVYGVVRTVNVELALSVKDESMSFLEERKASQPQVHQLPGLDFEFKILFTKVTLPVLDGLDDGRPKALQIETAAVVVRNPSLHNLLGDAEFEQALDVLRTDWLLQSQDTPQFPHYDNDLRALPSRLWDLLQQKVRIGRRRGERSSSVESGDSTGASGRSAALAPEETRSEMSVIEGLHVSTSCVQVSFVSTLTHKATLYTTPLINDFPVNAWIFLPPSSLDAKLHTPTSPTHLSASSTAGPGVQTSRDPRISFVVHIATPMRVEITRLQLLFLMRLKDSLNAFKASLMRFLDPEALSPGLKETLEARKSGKEESESMSVSGYVAISSVEASLLLPSLYTSRPSRSTNTDNNYTSDTTQNAHATNSVEVTVACESEETSMTGSVSIDNQHNHAHLYTSDSLASLSTAESESILGGRRGSLESLSVGGVSGGITPSPSGSLASLPVIMESEYPTATKTITDDPARPGSANNHDQLSASRQTSTSHSTSVSSSPSSPSSLTATTPGPVPTASGSTSSVPSSTVPLSSSVNSVSLPTEACANHNSSPSKQSDDEFIIIPTVTQGTTHPSPPHPSPLRPLPSEVVQTHGSSSASHSTLNTAHTTTNLTSQSSKSSLLSHSSQRKLKSPALLRAIPEYILHAEVRHICVVPNIQNTAITARVAIDTVGVRELTNEEHKGMKEMAKKKKPEGSTASQSPSVKARLEVGNQVKRFYAEDHADFQDIIAIATAEGLDLTLLLPNMTILKDFFDDEYVSEKPLPLHMKVAGTRAVLMENIEHGADHVQSMSVAVDQLEVHKGRELAPGLDVFRQELDRFGADGALTPSEEEEDMPDACDAGKDHQLLLDSFSQFKAAFEAHVHNGTGVLSSQTMSLLQSQLQHLHAALVTPPPPPYTPPAIAMTRKRSNTVLSSQSELLHLRREVEGLRHVQRESERLSAQVRESQVALDRQMAEFLMVTDECKRVKEELVSYKQVMEKQQEQVDKLLSENFDLRYQLESLPR